MIVITNSINSWKLSHIRLFNTHMDILKNINPILCDIYKLIISDLSTYSWLDKKAKENEICEQDIGFLNMYSSLLDITQEYIPYHIHQFVFNSAEDVEFSADFCESLYLELVELDENVCPKLMELLKTSKEHNLGMNIHQIDIDNKGDC